MLKVKTENTILLTSLKIRPERKYFLGELNVL
jgi:hypothetical protein